VTLIDQQQLDRRLAIFSRSERVTASALFGRSCQLLDAAQNLEREAGHQRDTRDDAQGTTAAIDAMAPTLEAIANASLLLSLVARDLLTGTREEAGEESDHVTRLLFGASQNVRIAAEAGRLAAAALRQASPSAA
jgi:hypothetical protein